MEEGISRQREQDRQRQQVGEREARKFQNYVTSMV